MNILLDAMGGDYAPQEAIKGVKSFLSEDATTTISLVGSEELCMPLLKEHEIDLNRVSFIPSTQVIEMHEHPTKALKEKQNSSIAIGFQHLKEGNADAFISAGNTGAMLVGTAFSIKAIEGVLRPTIGSPAPKLNGGLGLLLDVGLNADCKPELLDQFAVLGSVYSQEVLGIANPRVGLVNIGEEEGKGNLLAQATYPLLKNNSLIHFIGNVEGRDLLLDKADIYVCEGFVGNVILKTLESVYTVSLKRKIKDEYFDRFNFEYYGGTPILGVSKPVIIGHGISSALAFKNMIHQAKKMLDTDLCGKMKQKFSQLK